MTANPGGLRGIPVSHRKFDYVKRSWNHPEREFVLTGK